MLESSLFFLFTMKTAIRQHDPSDCAAACLASIARHYGTFVPVTVIREMSGTSRAGTSIKGILDACDSIGFSAKAYKSDDKRPEDLGGFNGPVILHLLTGRGDLHFVVLYGTTSRKAVIMDPRLGKTVRIPMERLLGEWTGYLIDMKPEPGREPAGASARGHDSVWSCMKLIPSRDFILMIAGSVLYIVAGLCTALFLQHIIDRLIPQGDTAGLLRVGLLMAAVMLCTLGVGYGRTIYALRLSITMDSRLILDYLQHLFKLPSAFFTRRGTGELHARIGDAARVRSFLIEGIPNLLTSVLILAVSFALMFTTHWRLSLLMLTFIPVYLALYLCADKVNKRVNREIIEQSAAFEESAVEGISSVRTIRYFGGGARVLRTIEKEYMLLSGRLFSGGRKAGGFASAADGISKLLTLTLLTAGSAFIFSGSLTVGSLVSFYALTSWFSAPLGEMVRIVNSGTEARISFERLCDITLLPPEEEGQEGLLPAPGQDIVFDNITFSYPGACELFHDFTLRLGPGRITAVRGESGCGKSTLASLLMRDYTVQRGAIRLGRYDIRLFPLEEWRRYASIVPQDPHLTGGTLLDSITGLDPEPDIDLVAGLLDELDLTRMVRELPMGLFTRIGERGCTLSGGQCQRIALARALYRKPSLLILDEATAALDEASQKLLLERVMRFRDEGGTVMMITHNSGNAAFADTIATI